MCLLSNVFKQQTLITMVRLSGADTCYPHVLKQVDVFLLRDHVTPTIIATCVPFSWVFNTMPCSWVAWCTAFCPQSKAGPALKMIDFHSVWYCYYNKEWRNSRNKIGLSGQETFMENQEQVKIVCSSAKRRRRRVEFQENRECRKSWGCSIYYYETFLSKT